MWEMDRMLGAGQDFHVPKPEKEESQNSMKWVVRELSASCLSTDQWDDLVFLFVYDTETAWIHPRFRFVAQSGGSYISYISYITTSLHHRMGTDSLCDLLLLLSANYTTLADVTLTSLATVALCSSSPCYIHPLAQDNWPHIKYRVVGSLLLDAHRGWFNLILSACRDTRSDENATICVHCSLLALLPLGHGLIINFLRLASVSTTPMCRVNRFLDLPSYRSLNIQSSIHKNSSTRNDIKTPMHISKE